MIVIATYRGDFHAILIADYINKNCAVDCRIFETDSIAHQSSVSFGLAHPKRPSLLDCAGGSIDLDDARVLWVRRLLGKQLNVEEELEADASELIQNDCNAALPAILRCHFNGVWVSDLDATVKASDKIYQLKIASDAGFRIPKTVVTQSKDDVVDLLSACPDGIIVKHIAGINNRFLVTQRLSDVSEIDADAFRSCPAIYQEYIDGERHIRLNVFGDRAFAAELQSQDVDWRPNLNIPITQVPVEESIYSRSQLVLEKLGLRMGMIDLKIDKDGDIVWFEVNPQGQFLFLDPLAKLNLRQEFSEFLCGQHG